jgi:hypothetical protein
MARKVAVTPSHRSRYLWLSPWVANVGAEEGPLLMAAPASPPKARIVRDRQKPGLLILISSDGKSLRQVIYQPRSPASEQRARSHLEYEARSLGYLLLRTAG